ncbi:hypothetical protein EDC17_102625 [Sphingobacterium alimentarium]|uniref:Sortase n=1 Tax=Sphingobacterium alimentarium TaxID=797292 RepID=A0A4R3VS64_9SPHI|nr:DUF6358 family protein [Sphingobacterium alimentarium]TCV11842.1 hypothetical protein EDC17_102625 [Sphingobacterium alimentarium]
MKKQFVLNLLLNLGIIFLLMSGISAYQSGNMLILGLAIAICIVLIYLKVVLLKHVKEDFKKKQAEKHNSNQKINKKG